MLPARNVTDSFIYLKKLTIELSKLNKKIRNIAL